MRRAQGFNHLYLGLLFATSCAECIEVPVPLDHGIKEYQFPEDLRVYSWINIAETQMRTMPLKTHCITEYNERVEHCSMPDGSNLYFWMEPQFPPVTGVFNEALNRPGSRLRVTGDVLFVKIGAAGVIDLAREDASMVAGLFSE
jgi:hypothetical protein